MIVKSSFLRLSSSWLFYSQMCNWLRHFYTCTGTHVGSRQRAAQYRATLCFLVHIYDQVTSVTTPIQIRPLVGVTCGGFPSGRAQTLNPTRIITDVTAPPSAPEVCGVCGLLVGQLSCSFCRVGTVINQRAAPGPIGALIFPCRLPFVRTPRCGCAFPATLSGRPRTCTHTTPTPLIIDADHYPFVARCE